MEPKNGLSQEIIGDVCAYFFSILKDLLTSEISPPPDSEETNRVHFDFKRKGELRKEQELATSGLRNQKRPEEARVCLMELSEVTGTSCLDAQVARCDSETVRIFLLIPDLVPV